MGVGLGYLLGVGGSQGWRKQKERACPRREWRAGAALGRLRVALASLTRPLSPEQPAVHNLALQAGGVCLQPVPEQREPQPGGSHHPHHHEPESHRSVASSGVHHVARAGSCDRTTVHGVRPSFCSSPEGEPLSSASSHLFMRRQRPVCWSRPHARGPTGSSVICRRSGDCVSRKLSCFPLASCPPHRWLRPPQ